MNNSLLNDDDYVDFMNKIIDNFNKDRDISAQTLWELLKSEIKSSTIQFCSEKNFINKTKQKNNQKEIDRISYLLVNHPNCPILNKKFSALKLEQELYDMNLAKGAQVRSRIKFIEEGEKNTKYFLNLEKARGTINTIFEINTKTKNLVDPISIIDEIKTFYSDLYAKDDSVDDSINSLASFVSNSDYPILNEVDKSSCEDEISLHEMGLALNSLNNDSSPGCDGISIPFYKVFWNKIKNILLVSFNEALNSGELSTTQKRGIITLLHKGGNKNDLNNWRPISVLNSDYKILSKVIALRMQAVLPKIISQSQYGFLKGRNITEIIRNIDDILQATYTSNSPGLLASVDFRKAFDTLSKKAILNSLQLFNFGPYLINLVSVLMCKSESCVKNAGWLSSWFPCERGVRQGCSSSPYLFIVAAELLSIKIRSVSSTISEFNLSTNNTKIPRILQYADDTTLFVKSEADLESALNIIDSFGNVSGLKLNRKKSIVLPIGGFVRDFHSNSDVKWLKDEEFIKIVGVYFGAKLEASKIELNWKSKIEHMLRTINRWNRRKISLYGKIIISKTFLLSKINYIIQSLSLPSHVLEEIDKILFKFIWQKKFSDKKAFEKVKRSVMCKNITNGGLNMISVKDQQKVFHIKWLKTLYLDSEKNSFSHFFLNKLGGINYLLHCSSSVDNNFLEDNIKSFFWKEVLQSWFSFKINIDNEVNTIVDILSQPIFLNSEIKYKGKSIYIKQFVKANVRFVVDIINNKQLRNHDNIKELINSYPGLVFDINAICNALGNSWKSKLNEIKIPDINDAIIKSSTIPVNVSHIFNKNNKEIRDIINNSKNNSPCCENFWRRKLNTDITIYYDIAFNATSETRLRMLHFKILHNIYPTGIMLQKMKIKENNLCESCQVRDYIEHFFVHCKLLNGFWSFVKNKILSETNIPVNLTEENILFGFSRSHLNNISQKCLRYINFIILIGKMSVSKFKYGKTKNLFMIFDHELNLRSNCYSQR